MEFVDSSLFRVGKAAKSEATALDGLRCRLGAFGLEWGGDRIAVAAVRMMESGFGAISWDGGK